MPLLKTRTLNNHTLLAIWELTEQPEELLQLLPSHLKPDEVILKAHPRRQREWMASRILASSLLRHFTDEPLPLLRDENNCPYYSESGPYISITHSPKLAAVILSEKDHVGIDIELISPKALRVAEKFLTDTESLYTAGDEAKACLYWSAKETLYKMYSRRQLTLKENLFLQPAEETNVLLGRVQTDTFNKLYHVYYEQILNHVLTYSIDSHAIDPYNKL